MPTTISMNRWVLIQAFVVLLLTSMTVYWVAADTNWLGPYGTTGDTYHLIILVLLAFLVYMVATVTILKTVKVRVTK
jgi:hypothetical protein